MRWKTVVVWVLQVAVAVILGQTLFFKLTYAPQTQVIFDGLGGRPAATLAALGELVAAVLLLIPGALVAWGPRANAAGAFLALGVLGGAIMTHLAVIGIDIPIAPGSDTTDGGSLFALAVGTFVMAAVVLWLRRDAAVRLVHAVTGRAGRAHSATP